MARLISGKEVSREVLDGIKAGIAAARGKHADFSAGLAIVQVGDLAESNVYIGKKIQSCKDVGIDARLVKLSKSSTQSQVLETVNSLNADSSIHGIIVQLPLDTNQTIDSHLVTNSISAEKDVDGLTSLNAGHLAQGDLARCIPPCTPNGCMELIKKSGVTIAGAKAVVIGRSKIVGAPMAALLTWHNASVTVCHSKTKDLAKVCSEADILVVAIGRGEMVTGDFIKPGAVVIDCGINSIEDATRKSGRRLVGDVHFESASNVAGAITPVPGGVGPMTVAMLLRNTYDIALRAYEEQVTKIVVEGGRMVGCTLL